MKKYKTQMNQIDPSAFQRYSFSDYLDNVVRGSLGEYVVASKLGVTDTPQSSWESWDITYNGIKIEVKTSAYAQTWKQKELSTPRFGIQKRQGYQEDGDLDGISKRHADIYVFCLFTFKEFRNKDVARKAVLGIENWRFYVVATKDLPEQDTIGLWGLGEITECISYGELKTNVDCLINEITTK